MSNETKIAELKSQIAILQDAAPDSPKLGKLKEELRKLGGSSSEANAGGLTEIPGVSDEDYESAGGSKFAQAGLHKSEFGMPYWKTPGISIAFPFTIIEGADEGKQNEIFAGVSKAAIWKLKEILLALGVKVGKNPKTGNIAFDFAEVASKIAQTLWQTQLDTRPAEEGGTGGSYTKPVSVLPLGSGAPKGIV